MHSQNNEDALISYIFKVISPTNKFFVEFGTGENATECNTAKLRTEGWTGVMWDLGANENPSIGLYKEKVTRENVLGLFKKYNVPVEFDFLSIDVDFNDWHMWREIGKEYKPRVVCIEYNFQYSPYTDVVVTYRDEGNPVYAEGGPWTSYQGASMLAMYRLGRHLGYSIVGSDEKGINLFFVRDDTGFPPGAFLHLNNIKKIYNYTFFSRLHHDIIGYPIYKNDMNTTSAREILGLADGTLIDDHSCEYIQWHIPLYKKGNRNIIPFNPAINLGHVEEMMKY